MLVPAIIYGPWSAVKPRLELALEELIDGARYDEAMIREGMVDTGELSGFLLLDSADIEFPHFHLCGLLRLMFEAQVDSLVELRDLDALQNALEWHERWARIMDRMIEVALESTWGIASMLGANHSIITLLARKHWWDSYLLAASTAWAELDAEGPRYSMGIEGQWLWNIPNLVHFILVSKRVPRTVLSAPLPPEGPIGLLRYVKVVN